MSTTFRQRCIPRGLWHLTGTLAVLLTITALAVAARLWIAGVEMPGLFLLTGDL